jgi:hypothetical protein
MSRKLAISAFVAMLGATPYASAAPLSVQDTNAFTVCMRRSQADFHNDPTCADFMTKMKISESEMNRMKTCRAQQWDRMVSDSGCKPLVEKYPDMMLLPNGSLLSPGGTDVNAH